MRIQKPGNGNRPGRLARLVSFVFFVLACFALPQQAAAQNSINLIGTTFTISDATATEGGTARFEITTEPAAVFNLNFSIQYTAGSADLADLGSGRPSTLDFTGRTSITLEVPIADDDTVEGEETFTVQVTLSPGFTIQATGRIIDNDGTPPPAVDISIAPASATEGGDIRFPVTLSTVLLEARTLNIGYTAGSGNTGASLDDLGGDRPTTLTLPTGTTTVNLVVPTVDDTDDENNETFTVTLSLPDPPANPANTLNITTNTATGTINDNDETPDAEVSITNASVAENAAAGTIGFTVSLDRAVDSDVTLAVAYAAVTATLVTDLGTRPTTVTIDRGQTEATLMVPVTNDAIVEGNETFTVTLSEGTTALPDGVTIGADNAATGTITDADTAGVSLSSTDPPPAAEGGTITFTVNLDNPVAETFSLGWAATDGTATVDDDLDDQTGTVEIPANAETATFTIPVTNDDDIEGSETFTVALTGAPTGLATIAANRITVDRASATGTINASDAAGANTVTIGNRSVAENVSGGSIGFTVTLGPPTATAAEDGEFTYTVSLSRAADDAVTVRWTAAAGPGDTATVDDDLRETTGTVTFAARNNTAQTFTIRPVDDLDDEDNETFTVTLEVDGDNPLPTGVTIGSSNSSTATITDDDEAPAVTATVSIDDESVVENVSGGTVTFTAALTAAVDSPVVLAVEVTAGTATLGVDLGTDLPTTVTIDANTTEATFTVPITDDTIVEGNETFTVTLSESDTTDLPDGVTIRDGIATGTITDNDEAPPPVNATVSIADADPVAEGAGPARFTISLGPQALTSAAVLNVAYAPGTATNGTQPAIPEEDLRADRPATVTIPAGRSSVILEVPIADDGAVEG